MPGNLASVFQRLKGMRHSVELEHVKKTDGFYFIPTHLTLETNH